MSEPVTRTVEVTIRVGAVISFLAYISPRLHVFPSTEIMILFSNVIFTLQPKGQPIQVSSCFSIALSLLYSDRDFLKICYVKIKNGKEVTPSRFVDELLKS